MKKVAIMQPYFFPYTGYFSLIKGTDQFILLDTVQYIRHGWINRNRILKQDGEWLYIKVPLLKQSHAVLIKDVFINNKVNWRDKIIAQLQVYSKIAPNYHTIRKLISDVLERDYHDIVSLNKATLESVCEYLGIKKELDILSKMDLRFEEPKAPDEWSLNICKALGDVGEYWNAPGGQSFFDKSKYDRADIELKFQKPILQEYDQKRDIFEPGLSIIDAIMFNPPEVVSKMLDQYELI
jgi:hypothetical protein